jgi:hypothetical protein
MTDKPVYEERVTSDLTHVLFTGLTIVFLMLLVWRIATDGPDPLVVAFALFFAFFLFYTLNYRTLVIRLSPDTLRLGFGVFAWTIRLDNVADCRLDDLPLLMRCGGAGIHFMLIRRRYRASFNFLEHPRVVVALRRRIGPVRDVSFSTRRPDDVIRLLQAAASARSGA